MLSRTTALTLLALLASLANLSAQTPKYVTAPPGYQTVSGANLSNCLGGGVGNYLGRVMLGEGTLHGPALTVTRVDYRAQSVADYDHTSGMGRSFSKVTLTMAHTNVDMWTLTSFSANVLGAATKVFDSKVRWPTLRGKIPQIWGFPVSFPFKAPWKYNGMQDMLFDYEFKGTTLANGGSRQVPYLLDAAYTSSRTWRDVVPNWLPYWPSSGGWRCGDSAFPLTPVASARITMKLYSKNHFDQTKAGMAEISATSIYTAPNAPVLGVISTGGHHKGINLGAGCYDLHVDLTRAIAYLYGKGSALTGSATLMPKGPYPYSGKAAGARLYLQAAWADSVTNQLSLSVASWLTLPPKAVQLRKKMMYRYSPTQLWMSGAGPAQTLPRLTLK